MTIHPVPRPPVGDKPSKRKLKAPLQTGLGAHLRGLAVGYEKMAKVTGEHEDANSGCARGLRQAADLVDSTMAGQVGAEHVVAVLDLVRQVTGALVEAAEQVREAAADILSAKADGIERRTVDFAREVIRVLAHGLQHLELAGRQVTAHGPRAYGSAGGIACSAGGTQGVTRELITLATGFKRSTRDAYVLRLMKKGLVEDSGDAIVATPAGRDKMPAGFKPIPKSPAKMREHYLSTLPGGTWPTDPEDPPEGYWRTKEGKVIAMADMTDDHLKNAIAMLKRKKMRWHWKFAELTAERVRRKGVTKT